MRGIQRLSLAVELRDKTKVVSRVMAFSLAEPERKRENERASFIILFEVDVIDCAHTDTEGDTERDTKRSTTRKVATSVRTYCVSIPLLDRTLSLSEIDTDAATGELSPSFSSFSLRLPYKLRSFDCMLSNSLLSRDFSRIQRSLITAALSSAQKWQVCCKFCDGVLVEEDALETTHPLPTGLFDDSIHEFLCCQDTSCMTLTLEDMAISEHCLYVGSTFAVVKGAHMRGCEFLCKAHNTLFDIYTNIGCAMYGAMMKLSDSSKAERRRNVLQACRSVIGVDSAAIHCARCDSCVGDARLMSGEIDLSQADMDAEFSMQDFKFPSSDVDSARLYWNRIAIKSTSTANESPINFVSIEQMIARVCLHVFEKLNAPSCCFFGAANIEHAISSNQDIPVIVLRLLNKNVRKFDSDQSPIVNGAAELQPFVQISAKMGVAADILQGKEFRVPLDNLQFKELKKLIEERSNGNEANINALMTFKL